MKVFVTGATGLIGRRLVAALQARGDEAVPLSRKPLPGHVVGDPTQPGPWLDVLANCDAVVHLAGEPILEKRWTDAFLQTLKQSRVDSTRRIAERLGQGNGPRVFVSGSAVGYYGIDCGEAVKDEASASGNDVLSDICTAWESAAEPAKAAGVRVCHPRTGIVLDPAGGALPQMALPFRLFAGGRIGSGRQYLPWIHHGDMVGLLLHALDQPMHGPFNCCSPNPVTNRDFSATLAKVLRRPNLFPAPGFMLRLLLGRGAALLLGGQRAVPQVAETSGYRFRFPGLDAALNDLFA